MKSVKRMMQDIERGVAYTASRIGKRALDPRVMDAMQQVPRHEFVPGDAQAYAYEDGPVPIGHGQTISQPYIVALMTDLLNPEPEHVVLEVGTGSGYQAAILSLLVNQVYSTEIVGGIGSDLPNILNDGRVFGESSGLQALQGLFHG